MRRLGGNHRQHRITVVFGHLAQLVTGTVLNRMRRVDHSRDKPQRVRLCDRSRFEFDGGKKSARDTTPVKFRDVMQTA
jgi:hypothetical protein